MIKSIRKRDGRIVEYTEGKIVEAICRAVKAVGGSDMEKPKKIARQVSDLLALMYRPGHVPTVEEVQDLVEKMLIKNQHDEVAKAYILYRNQHSSLRQTREMIDKSVEAMEDYLTQDDWRVNENSNMGYSLQGLNNHIASVASEKFWLDRVYPQHIGEIHKAGDFHIHDLSMVASYCCGWDLKDILLQGFTGAYGKVSSKPAKHFRTALGQLVNFFYTLQGEAAGAQAVSSFDTLLAPFISYDDLGYSEVKQAMQEFIFNLNVPTRVGFQTPFTNLTMDMACPSNMAHEAVVIGGEMMDETYSEFQEEMDMINRAFCEIMSAGDAEGRPFGFPIPTYNITEDLDFDSERFQPIWEMTTKYGIPYFSNYINSDMDPEDARSMCCRLRLDNRELIKRGGGLFGSNPLTGSVGVVTINMPRAAFVAKDKDEFFARIAELMELAKDSLELKRKTVERFTDDGLYPYTKHYLKGIKAKTGEYWANHFATIGLIGMNEACLNLIGKDIASPEGKALSEETLEMMRTILEDYQEETGHLYNLEATPGEGTSYRLAQKDADRFPGIIQAGESEKYYTNSTQLPVGYSDDLFEAMSHQDSLQTKYTGGTVFHAFLGEKIEDWRMTRMLVEKLARNFHMPYFSITPTYTICPEHGYIPGEHFTCPCQAEAA